jgi:ribonuclease HI
MAGINRDNAVMALKAGWDPNLLQLIHAEAQKQGADCTWHDFGFSIKGNKAKGMFYQHTTIEDALDIFSLRGAAQLRNDVVAYADGSGTTFDKLAGIGVYITVDGRPYQAIPENVGIGTNNRAELLGIWRCLRAFPRLDQSILIRSDSEYARGVLLNLDWNLSKNVALIQAIRQDLALRKGYIEIEHVDGHSGIVGNEMADKLAGIGRKILIDSPIDYKYRDL